MNTFTCIGRLGRDSVLVEFPQGDTVLNFSVAVSTGTRDKPGTMWLDCSLFGKRGQALEQHLIKGKLVALSGKLSTSETNGKTYIKLAVSDLELLGGRETAQDRSKPQPTTTDEMNDDIPF